MSQVKRKREISTKWRSGLAYAIGLLAADGYLSSDKRHLELTSKDKEQIINFKKCLGLKNKISKKTRAKEKIKRYYRVQFGSVKFYKFLESIGLKNKKSKTLEKVDIPDKYFPDFIRGYFDGDGSFGIFKHPESKHPQVKLRFTSASIQFLKWIKQKLEKTLNTEGFICKVKGARQLTYCKKDSIKLLNYMYYSPKLIWLSRKKKKINYFKEKNF